MCSYAVPQLRGKDENEIFKNFMNDICMDDFTKSMNDAFKRNQVPTKDDQMSEVLRKWGNELFAKMDNVPECLALYNKSLLHATYNNECYALALANRSAALYQMKEYQCCLDDIELCLKAAYPNALKPKVTLRKANCYKSLGDVSKMKKTAKQLLKMLTSDSTLTTSLREKYKTTANKMLSEPPRTIEKVLQNVMDIPKLPHNPNFLNASPNIELKTYDHGSYVVAKTNIPVGDVLFVEKAYVFYPRAQMPDLEEQFFCQYCLKEILNIIPCETCTNFIYCSEKCKKLAWNEFHQWGCYAVEVNFFGEKDLGRLVFRLTCKSIRTSCTATKSLMKKKFLYCFGDDYYDHYIYPIPVSFDHEAMIMDVNETLRLVYYLKWKTTFFSYMKQCLGCTNTSEQDLIQFLGALNIRHSAQLRYKSLVSTIFDDRRDVTMVLLCPSVNNMSHSCDPNTIHYFEGDTIIVRAKKVLKPNEHIVFARNNFACDLLPLKKRKELLQMVCNIKCQCPPCLDPLLNVEVLDSYICIRCGGPAVPSETNDVCACLKCFFTYLIPLNVKEKMLVCQKKLKKFFINSNKAELESAIALGKTFLKPNNSFFLDTYETVACHYLNKQNYLGYFDTIQILLTCRKERYRKNSLEYIRIHYVYCEDAIKVLTLCRVYFPHHKLREILNNVEISLNIVTKLSKIYYSRLLQKTEELRKVYMYLNHLTP